MSCAGSVQKKSIWHYKGLYCEFNVPLLNTSVNFFQKQILLTPEIWAFMI